MTSKYDTFWSELVPTLRRALERAADGEVVEVDVRRIAAYGERQSWYGTATVCGDRIGSADMAHARALARALVDHGLAARHPTSTFRLTVTTGLMLRVHLDGARPVRRSPAAEACAEVHALLAGLPRYDTPRDVPFTDGLYFFFEAGEASPHAGGARITRVGNHPHAQGGLRARLLQHYRTGRGAKNASVFRRSLGGAILRRRDPAAACLRPAPGQGHWERQGDRPCADCEGVEAEVTRRLREAFSFSCVPVADRETRNRFEARLIATMAACRACRPSDDWLGHSAYPRAVRRTGLWNTQHVGGPTLTSDDLAHFRHAAALLR